MTRVGDWMQTFTGLQYWPLDPRPEEVNIDDIAHALSNICRYNGHCNRFYSVAEHSVYVSMLVPAEHAVSALLHDATEAYVCDVPRPLKRFLSGYAAIEEKNWQAIAKRFLLPPRMHQSIKDADNAALLAEKDYLLGPQPAPWAPITLPDGLLDEARHVLEPVKAHAMSPREARLFFLNRFEQLLSHAGVWR